MQGMSGMSGLSGLVGGAAGAAFSPSDVANTMLEWVRADTGTWQDTAETTAAASDGDPVGRWADTLSASGDNLDQTTSPKKPTLKLAIVNGQPVVRFDGFDDILKSGVVGSYAQPLSFFAVFANSSTVYGYLSDSRGASVPGVVVNQTTLEMACYAGGADLAKATTSVGSAGAFHYGLWEINGASTKFFLDGSDDGSDADATKPGAAAYDQFDMGGNGSIFSQIDVAERVVWDGALSAGDKTGLWSYAVARYGL